MKDERIFIFDTTLRDGQQSPGAGMSFEDNLTYAQYAHELGVDILEAGFPAASRNDFEIVNLISSTMTSLQSPMIIAALCQLREEQLYQTMRALEPSQARGKARVHTYVPVDPHLLRASLGDKSQDYSYLQNEVFRLISIAVKNGYQVEFSPEGYSRMGENFDFTTDLIRTAVSAGATVINCPDTIGGASRFEGNNYFVKNMKKHAAIVDAEFGKNKVIWSVHCHNDLGLALDNTLSAVFSGPARQIEGCMNGVGERAGNVALEQCIMAIHQFGKLINQKYAYFTNAKLDQLTRISNFIADKMLGRQPHWPITGENAAKHTSGGHTNAILTNPLAYQPFNPEQIGNNISFVFGPLSGGNHLKHILNKHGYACSDKEKAIIAQVIKNQFAHRRKGISDEEVIQGYLQYCRSTLQDKNHIEDRGE